MNDPDMESLAPEEIQLNGNPNNSSLLTPEANANVVDEGITHTKELQPNKESKNPKDNTPITQENATFLHILKKIPFSGWRFLPI